MTRLARRIEYDEYSTARKVFPNAQNSVNDLHRAVILDQGKPLKIWVEIDENHHAWLNAEYSVYGEPRYIAIKMQNDE